MSLPPLDVITSRVAAHTPATRPMSRRGFRAAVAVVLTDPDDPAVLVIGRARRPGDPWSGDAAFPGGKCEDQDADVVATARRETEEEVGITLPATPVGQLDEIGGRRHPGHVTPIVFRVPERLPFVLETTEVASAHWVPLSVLVDPDRRTRTPTRYGPFPAWTHEDLTIWGMTHSILQGFLDVIR